MNYVNLHTSSNIDYTDTFLLCIENFNAGFEAYMRRQSCDALCLYEITDAQW